FKAVRGFKIALAIAGSLAIEGPVLSWVADHRRHHKYSDREGDPHSPWRFGNDWKALTKGLIFAHVGWLVDGNVTSTEKFCPDWLADRDVSRISRWFGGWVAVSMLAPALIGGLWSMSWAGAATAFFWATLVRIALAVAGSMSLEMSVTDWVATHRRHHKYSDLEGDPHSPWRFGSDWRALTKGMVWAHVGWLFDSERTSPDKFCPDLVADKDMRIVSRLFPVWVAASLLLPAALGGLLTMSWWGAATGFFWGALVRICVLHHVTWCINSICHAMGEETFESRDKSRNVWWLAIPSFGESWHNLHHADPTCARHGALKGQLDSSARVIWAFEKAGWVSDVRWPNAERLAAKRIS
ncbi:MAG: fatty acid desaturase, partial [Gemmatimonadales bacterium]